MASKEKKRSGVKRKEVSSGLPAPDSKKRFLTRPTKKKVVNSSVEARKKDDSKDSSAVQWKSTAEQARWLTENFLDVCSPRLSALERDPIPEASVMPLSDDRDRTVESVSIHIKSLIPKWRNALGLPRDGTLTHDREAGSPTLLVVCSSAVRCVELLRGLTCFTKLCKPVKLFAKHIKVEEQISLLKEKVYIAAGTPSRVKKLADLGALGFGHLSLVLLDMHRDAKGLNLLSLPEVRSEFWELFRTHLRERVLNQQLKLCLY